jgi:hypothetical protein
MPPEFVPLDEEHERAAIAALVELIHEYVQSHPLPEAVDSPPDDG